jgi:hypothetical protein
MSKNVKYPPAVLFPTNPAVTPGRKPTYSEEAAINLSNFDTKIFYMYREVIISLLISFPQDRVSNFLFGGPINTNAAALKKMFKKDGEIETTVFDKVVWFSYNARNYANNGYNNSFFDSYPARGNFLNTVNQDTFNIELASQSISLILCRYLFTVFKTIQERQQTQGKSGGGKGKAKNSNKSNISETLGSSEMKHLVDNANSGDIISTNCELFEKALFVDKVVDDDGKLTESSYNENIININADIIRTNKSLIDEITSKLVTPTPERRSCSRLVEQKAAADAVAAEESKKAKAEQERKEQERLALIIETKKQMDAALAAAGQDYSNINVIVPTHFSRDTGEYYLTTTDAEFLTYLAKTSCTLTKGSLNMLLTHNINDKSTVAGFFARLGLLQKSVSARKPAEDEEEDEEVGNGGGRGKNILHQKGGAVILPEGFRQIGLRLAIEGIGAANQCMKGVGAIKDIPRIKCYICGELWLPAQKTMECEHIFCVGLAAQYFGLLRSSDFSEKQKLVLSILYAWAHRCCNQLKSNLSFMKFKNDPNDGFVFHEKNAIELLNNIYGNHSFDCDSVNGSISKTFDKNKKGFTETRKVVLSKYCRPLISEINDMRARLFFGNAALFSFMGILKIAATSLVLFTGLDHDNLAIKSKDMISLLSLFNEDIKVEARKISKKRGRGGGKRQLQFGGTLGEDLKRSYVINVLSLLKWNIESSIPQPVEEEVEEEVVEQHHPVIVDDGTVYVKFLNEYNFELTQGDVQIPINSDAKMLNEIVRINWKQPTGSWNFSVKGRPDDGQHHSISSHITLKNVIETMGLSTEDVVEIICTPSGPPSVHPPVPPPGHPSVHPPPYIPNDILVFKLLAHTHAMNTHTIPNALINLANSGAMMIAIADITNNYWRVVAHEKGITKNQASVLQLLVLISPDTIHDRLDIQSTINTHYLEEYKQLVEFVCVQPLTPPDMNKFCRLCLILCPGGIPSVSITEEQKQKFLNELHEDIYLFVNNYHIEQLNPLKSKIKNPFTETRTDIDRHFVFDSEAEHGCESEEEEAEESVEEGAESSEEQASKLQAGDIVDLKTKNNRIRNLLFVIGGVYLRDNELSRLNRMMHHIMISEPVKFPNFSEKFEEIYRVTRGEVPHIFIYIINLLIEQLPESNTILNIIFRNFLVEKFMLFKPESPKPPMSMDDSPDSTTSPHSDSTSSLPLSPSSNPAPHMDISPEIANHIIESTLELISLHSDTCIFDSTNLLEYLDYFNWIVLEDGYQVLLGINKPEYQSAIDHLLSYSNSNSRHGGSKRNKKKLTKRRLVQHRLYKQYSKKKRNTSSNKGKKRVSIKHKRSRTKHHDTRKRRK